MLPEVPWFRPIAFIHRHFSTIASRSAFSSLSKSSSCQATKISAAAHLATVAAQSLFTDDASRQVKMCWLERRVVADREADQLAAGEHRGPPRREGWRQVLRPVQGRLRLYRRNADSVERAFDGERQARFGEEAAVHLCLCDHHL